jgi:dinuclear metal center YbgI/SA1388 family protein
MSWESPTNMAKVQDLVQSFEQLWPSLLAESWDTPGLVVGQAGASVGKVLLTVDLTYEVLDHAIQGDFDFILAHHPYLMRGVTTLSEETVKGSVVTRAIRAGVAVYAAHTNADSAVNGVSDSLANALGIAGASPMVESVDGQGLGRFGVLDSPKSLGDIATGLARLLPATATGVRVAGDFHQIIRSVGVCGGAGDSLLPEAKKLDLDLFVTADLRHHVVQDIREERFVGKDIAIIDVSHWASEWLWLERAAQDLRKLHSDVLFEVCDLRTDPWDFVVTQ